jgi:hypothetical protein
MAKYNLTSSLDKTFTFSIEDKEFLFTKPTVRQAREMARLFSAAQKEEDPDMQSQKSQEAMREVYSFITPMGHSENIEDVLDNQTVDVQAAFGEMMKKELSLE